MIMRMSIEEKCLYASSLDFGCLFPGAFSPLLR